MSATLKFHGHACFSLTAGGKRVILDPFLENNPQAVEKPQEIECHAVLVSHAHVDHLGEAIQIAINNDALLVSTYEVALYCERQGVKNVFPMHIGGGYQFDFGHVKLVPATHSSSIVTDEEIRGISIACGFVLTMGGVKYYYPGDTGLSSEMELLGRYQRLDVTTLPIGDVFTMGMEDALIAAQMLRARLTIPMHYRTFPAIGGDPHEFVRRLEAVGLAGQVLAPGEEIEL